MFAVAVAPEADGLGASEFLAAYVASMVLYASVAALGAVLEAVASAAPACEQVRPILAGSPDTARRAAPPAVLGGAFRLDSVSFRQDDAGSPVLDRVSIHAGPGEFIAIVGESGAGKSTLIRLAFGLETPTGVTVYYDDRDLSHLDPASVRRQVGAALLATPLRTTGITPSRPPCCREVDRGSGHSLQGHVSFCIGGEHRTAGSHR